MSTTTTVNAGSTQTFAAYSDGAVFTVVADGGADVGYVTDEKGKDFAFQPSGMRRAFGPLASGQSIKVYCQLGAVAVIGTDVSPSTSSGAVGPVVRPVNNTDGALRDALNALKNTYGYGTLDLTGLSIGVDGPIDCANYHGITIAAHPQRVYSTAPPGGSSILDASVAFDAQLYATNRGQYNCFQYNDVDGATYPSTLPTVGDATNGTVFIGGILTRFNLKGLNFKGFKAGLKFGALRRMGISDSSWEDLWFDDCTEWGMYVENFGKFHNRGLMMFTGCGSLSANAAANGNGPGTLAQNGLCGSMLLGAAGGGYNSGNNEFNHVYITRYNNRNAAALEIQSRANQGGLNDLDFKHLTITSGSGIDTSITLTGASGTDYWSVSGAQILQCQVGQFISILGGAGSLGLADWGVYNIAEVDRALNRIRLKTYWNNAAYKSPTSTGSVTATLQGYPLMTLRSYVATQALQPVRVGLTDFENGGTSMVYMERAQLDMTCGLMNESRSATTATTLVARSNSQGVIRAHQQSTVTVDQDSTSDIHRYGRTIQFSGQGENSRPGIGITSWTGGTTGTSNEVGDGAGIVQLKASGEPSLFMSRMGALKLNANLQLAWTETGGATVDLSSGTGDRTLVSLTGNGQTCTLPQIYPAYVSGNSKSVGYWLVISNATANTQTVNSSASQTFRGGGASSASLSIPAYTTVEVWACSQAGTGYWAWK
jgi:hypothetical protein